MSCVHKHLTIQYLADALLILVKKKLCVTFYVCLQVLAEVCSWDLPPLPERYKKACKSLNIGGCLSG